jgi:hypothetical protein
MRAKVAPLKAFVRVWSYAHKRAVVHNLWVFIHHPECGQNQRRGLPFPGSLPLAPYFSHVGEISTSCVDEGGDLWISIGEKAALEINAYASAKAIYCNAKPVWSMEVSP